MPDFIDALVLSVRQLPDPLLRGIVLRTLLVTAALFALLWLAIGLALHSLLAGIAWAAWIVSILGVIAAPVLTFLLFPTLATLVLGFYAESIIRAVETRHFPDLGAAPPTRWGDQIHSVAGLAGAGIALNILALPIYLLVPLANVVLFLGLNGYLLGRGYFELVALRRLDWRDARRMWSRRRAGFLLMGTAVAGVYSIPLVNLLAPVLGTAAAVHLFERCRREADGAR